MDGDLWWNLSNIFRQDPSPEVDAAWETLQGGVANRIFVSEEDWIKMGMDPEVGVQFPGDVPMYVAEMNVFHLLHCVNVLRKGAFLDYYWYKRPIDPSYWTHFYHCLDMVRQEIMCLGSLDLATMVWVDLQDQPFPFFSINRTCRRWEDIVRYRDEFEINEEALNLMVHNMTKPLNSKSIPVPKEAKYLFEGYARWRRLDLNKDFEVIEMGDFGRSSMDVLPPVKPNPKNVHAS